MWILLRPLALLARRPLTFSKNCFSGITRVELEGWVRIVQKEDKVSGKEVEITGVCSVLSVMGSDLGTMASS